jgi:tetratricopeptide (TPR) repeat protein
MDDQDGINLAQIRAMAQNSLFGRAIASSPTTAVFYASILYAKTQSLQDAYLYAQALQANGEASRSVRLLERSGIFVNGSLEQQVEGALLAAQSLSSLGEWSEALTLLESVLQQEDDDDAGWQSLQQSMDPRENVVHPLARLCLLRGRGYDEISNPTRAAVYWKRALKIDANAVEALELLLGKSMLTPSEAYELITSLDVKMDWLRNLYLSRITVPAEEQEPPYDENQKMPAKVSIQRDMTCAFDKLWSVHKLDRAPEVLALAAIRSYSQYDLKASLSFCQELASIDPLCSSASFVFVATLVALDHRRLLFQLAHEWVEASPKSAWAWFAVGGYYYACGRYHVAQRHYMRATRLDPQCTHAWIAFGCAFAQCDESDQALASFRAAQRLAPAHHVPLLYMGMEYLRTNHLVLARHFLMAAHKSSGGDPLCLHELGVADYKRGEYATAAVWFHRSLVASGTTESEEPVDLCQDVVWEPTLFNLGQCYRKSKQFAEAERCFEKCLALSPVSSQCVEIDDGLDLCLQTVVSFFILVFL